MSGTTSSPTAPPVQIICKNGVYWVSMNMARLGVGDSHTSAFIFFLNNLKDTDVVRLCIHTGSSRTGSLLGQYLPVFNAVMLCRATVIGIIDHMFDDWSSYLLLACTKLRLTQFGQLTLSPLWNVDAQTIPNRDMCYESIAMTLLTQAENKGWLTAGEVLAVGDNTTVSISQDKLKGRFDAV